MTIRYELRLTAICEDCKHEWAPTAYTDLQNVTHVLSPECPKCLEEKQEAGKILRYFPDDVVNLLE